MFCQADPERTGALESTDGLQFLVSVMAPPLVERLPRDLTANLSGANAKPNQWEMLYGRERRRLALLHLQARTLSERPSRPTTACGLH